MDQTALLTAPIPPEEYDSVYTRYAERYPSGNLRSILSKQLDTTSQFLCAITPDDLAVRYETEKWCVAEVAGHVIDTERIMRNRAFSFARGGPMAMPDYDHDLYQQNAKYDEQTPPQLLNQFIAEREATIALYSSLPAEALLRKGTINGRMLSVRAIGFVIAGHEQHHLQTLREKYKIGFGQ
ncbi:MAG: DinB family protein [Balneolaceae bacterium]